MIKFKKLNDGAQTPKQGRDGDAGFDLYADKSCEIWPGGQATIPTGVACQLPEGFAGFIWPRSGMATRHMINVHAGLIDQNYRGEIQVCLINHGDRKIEIRKGDRVAQMVVSPFLTGAVEVDELDDTERGNNGFGSSGV